MRRTVLLSTFLVAAVLAPMLLQTNYCSPSPYSKLSKLELYVPDLNGQNVISGFRPEGILYEVELSLDPPDTAVLLVQAEDASATIDVTYDSLPISLGPNGVAPLTLAPDHSEIRVTVKAQDSKGWTYTVSIDRVDYCPCDDGNVCTYNFCNQSNQVCEYPAVPDGSICANLKGVCYGGVCSFVPVSVAIGPKEVVFDWTTDRCEDLDLPDGPARAVRMEDGEIVLFANNAPTYYVSRGPDFNTLQQVCDPPALVSADSPTPETYENWEWIWAAYREGTSIHALIHNEFHDVVAPTCKVGDPSAANPCWYNSITYAVSTDGGHSFSKPGAPAHVVAPAHEVWTPPATPQPHGFVSLIGYHGPGNIVRGLDDYYYALILLTPSQYDASTFRCLMRTDTLNDPASWRAWDGTGFNDHMESPYVTGNPVVPTCAPLNVGGASLTYNTYLGQYMAVDNGGDPCGIYLWLSPNLIHWGRPQLITQARWWDCEDVSETPLEPGWAQYTAIIDHADSTPNFERPGRTPYLYYTRSNEGGGLDRDLVRVPLRFTMGGPLCDEVDCDDQDQCTEDLCNGADGSCENTPIDCSDSNDCTIDTCSPTIGCEHAAATNGTPCGGGSGICQDGSCAVQFPCTEQGILDAIAFGGGPHSFDCATPTTVATTAEIVIDNDVVLDGGGNLTVDGNGDHRVFSVRAGVNAGLMDLTVTGGSTPDVGGGFLNAGTLSLTDVTISGNTAANIGGGLSNQPGATATLMRTTVEGNSVTNGSGGGIGGTGTITLTDTTVRGNQVLHHGGGIFQNGSMVLTNSTVSGNTAGYGGGLRSYAPGSVTLINSTVSSNVATGASGGAIVNEASITLISTTIAGNSAVGIGSAIWNSGTAALRNTIVAGDCEIISPLDSFGGNIESEGNTCGLGHPLDQVFVPFPSLNLQPLGNNGGHTQTHAIVPPSPALDWIDPIECVDAAGLPLPTDQRGELRPGGPGCDVGAFEVQP